MSGASRALPQDGSAGPLSSRLSGQPGFVRLGQARETCPRKRGPGWAGDTGTLGCAPFSLRARPLFRGSDYRETKYDSRALGEILDLKKMIRNPTPSRIWHLEFAKSLKKKKKIDCIRSRCSTQDLCGSRGIFCCDTQASL